MKTESSEVQAYFFIQGQSIKRAWDTLNSNIFMHHLKRGVSILVEIALYIIFFIQIMAIGAIPSNPLKYAKQFNEYITITTEINVEQLTELIDNSKNILFLFSFLTIGMAILVRRNRKKRVLIRVAFEEIEQMKNRYDEEFIKLELGDE